MFQTKVVEQIKLHFIRKNFFFWKSCRLWDSVKKYGKTRQVTRGNMMLRRKHVLCMRVNCSETRDAHLQYFILIASYSINSFWSRKMFCGNRYKKWETSKHLSVITICCAKFVSEEDQKRTFFCRHAACATLQEDRRSFYFSNNSAVLQHSIFLNTWQCQVAQQHTQNAFSLFHCDSG